MTPLHAGAGFYLQTLEFFAESGGVDRQYAGRFLLVPLRFLEGGQDYGGAPAKPVREWARELVAVTRLAKQRKQDKND